MMFAAPFKEFCIAEVVGNALCRRIRPGMSVNILLWIYNERDYHWDKFQEAQQEYAYIQSGTVAFERLFRQRPLQERFQYCMDNSGKTWNGRNRERVLLLEIEKMYLGELQRQLVVLMQTMLFFILLLICYWNIASQNSSVFIYT